MSRAKSTKGLPNYAIGLIAVVLVVVGLYLSFTKSLPWSGGYEIKAQFRNAQNVRVKSPVRIAGVNVGEVTKVESLPGSNVAQLTMEIKDAGRPIREDARMQLRPRLFLEGNLFVDTRPGSPSADELESGDTIPVTQTSNSVQIDQVLTSLQADVRGNLQLLLRELGNAFQKHGGAEGFRTLYKTGGPAFENTAVVNAAFLGTEEGDLSGVIRNFQVISRALTRHEPQLKDLVTNLRTVTGSFAAESDALQASIRELPKVLRVARPTFANLNAAFPSLRAFAREALPGTRTAPAALEAATPFIAQLRGLVSRRELRGLARDLRPTVPQLAKLTARTRPFMEESRALASCFNNVIIPWANGHVGDSVEGPFGRVFEEAGYGLVGIAGESRSGDANGQYIRVGLGGGTQTAGIVSPNAGQTFGIVPLGQSAADLDIEPTLQSSQRTRFAPNAPCENQDPPNLSSGGPGAGPVRAGGTGSSTILEGAMADTEVAGISRRYARLYMDYLGAKAPIDEGGASRRERTEFREASEEFVTFWEENKDRYRELVEDLSGEKQPPRPWEEDDEQVSGGTEPGSAEESVPRSEQISAPKPQRKAEQN